MLHIRLLGAFSIMYNDAVVALTRPQLKTLLVQLVLHHRVPLTRTDLRNHFWHAAPDGQPKANLRNLLYYLRQEVPTLNECIDFGREIVWRTDGPYRLDVAEFEAALQQAEVAANGPQQQAPLTKALALYQGELWPECREEWIFAERERLHKQYIGALEQLIQVLEGQREYRGALTAAQRLLHDTPLREESYRQVMHLYACLGDQAGIERTFQACQHQLLQKLKVAPSLPTRELYQRLTQVTPVIQPAPSSPFVERHQEWAHLQRAWETAQQGQPQCLLFTGDVGIGKTRLLTEFIGNMERQGLAVAATQCHPFTLEVAYAPLLDWLRTPLLRRRINTLSPQERAELAPLLPALYSEETPPLPLATLESWQRQRLYATLVQLFLSPDESLLLVLDNAQWCDQGTIDWLHYLFHVAPTAKLLLAGALSPLELRPHHPVARLLPRLQQSRLVTELRLAPLTQAGVAALGSALLGQPLTATASAQLYGVTAGNPLYVVEALTMLGNKSDLTQADAIVNALLRSPLVQATVQLYFAALSAAACELVGLAATIGHTFAFDLLAAATLLDRATLLLALDELLQRTLIHDDAEGAYAFSHHLLQKAAYTALSSAKRRLWHERVAQARKQLG